MINWGFVDGLSQTRYPWGSWVHPYNRMPDGIWTWFHDVLHTDGTPYRAAEVSCLRAHAEAVGTR